MKFKLHSKQLRDKWMASPWSILMVVALVITGIFVARVFLLVDDWKRDFTSNYASWSTDELDEAMRPLELPMTVESVAAKLLEWTSQAEVWRWDHMETPEESGSDANRRHIHLTRSTRWWQFVDDIHVTLVPLQQSESEPITQVQAESQSRLGKGDLGQNPRNLKELREGLLEALKE